MASIDSLQTRRTLSVGGKTYVYYSLPVAEEAGLAGISRLPVSMKVLLENLLRNEDGGETDAEDFKAHGRLGPEGPVRCSTRSQYPPGARADAGFHRRSLPSSTWPLCATR